ncbi:TRAP transporter small permease [Roseicyclus mahoneyensis]|uniref:TRAP transporter small permease protein n=1 Tax=Roseicyclus mahoneyensis TaxID=164332 RepID=A0A316GIH2_9RHOB|nr:TRAP transporter small permease [Roseicyclus mahoneyensis]PWK59190.1 TRAP-type C4-dicarboxylate transport system permease small subunit [Roseicyclus mahoneyensis]
MRPSRKYSLEGTIAAILFLILIAIVAVQILGRTPVMRGPVWTEEAARWVWVWMAFIGIAEVERQNRHLRMGFIGAMLPRRIRTVVFTIVDLAYLGVMAQLCWIGWKTVDRTLAASSVTLPFPTAALYASAFLCSILVIHRILRRILSGRSGDIEGTEAP